MTATDLVGYLASSLVLAAFCMRNMAALRALAIASNLAFITYGVMADLSPVLLLHLLLLPINTLRLACWRDFVGRAAALRASTDDRPRAHRLEEP